MLSRRHAFTGLAAIACSDKAYAQPGQQANLYGAADGYPVPANSMAQLQGNPWPPKYRVGAFSHLDQIYKTHTVNRAAEP